MNTLIVCLKACGWGYGFYFLFILFVAEGEDGFFFGLATAPAHVEDRLDDAWIQFAEKKSGEGGGDSEGKQRVDAVIGSASGDGGSQPAITSPRSRKPLKVAMEAMIRGIEKYMEVEGKEREEEARPNVTAWHNVPCP